MVARAAGGDEVLQRFRLLHVDLAFGSELGPRLGRLARGLVFVSLRLFDSARRSSQLLHIKLSSASESAYMLFLDRDDLQTVLVVSDILQQALSKDRRRDLHPIPDHGVGDSENVPGRRFHGEF